MKERRITVNKLDSKVLEDGTTVYRIRANCDFYLGDQTIRQGTLGGYVESGANFSDYHSCWIDETSVVYGNAYISGDTFISNSVVKDNATVCDFAVVMNSFISGNAIVGGDSTVLSSLVTDDAIVAGPAHVYKSQVVGEARVSADEFFEGATLEDITGRFKPDRHINEKYMLVPQYGENEGLFRLLALKRFNNYQSPAPVEIGELGGLVCGTHNLSTIDTSWISYDSRVLDRACVTSRAYVGDHSIVSGNAFITERACLLKSQVSGNTYVSGKSRIKNIVLTGRTKVLSNVDLVGGWGKPKHYVSKDPNKDLRLTGNPKIDGIAMIAPNIELVENETNCEKSLEF